MTSFFNFQKIKTSLCRETSSLEIQILPLEQTENPINQIRMIIEELENIFGWAAGYIEITSLYLYGVESLSLSNLPQIRTSYQTILKLFERLQNFTYSMPYLPQTIIIDFQGDIIRDIAFEIGLSADIIIASKDSQFQLNHLQLGISPSLGLLGFSSRQINLQLLKGWILSSKILSATDLHQNNFINQLYGQKEDRNLILEQLLNDIKKQSPVARIQTKRAFLEHILADLENLKEKEKSFLRSSLLSGDFLNYLVDKENCQFTTAKNFSKIIKTETTI